jgi:TPR repeat protein
MNITNAKNRIASDISNKPVLNSSIIKYLNISNMVKIFALILLGLFIYKKSTQSQYENDATLQYLAQPKIDDIYFLDFRLLSDNLRPKEKYRIAKVVDVTGDIITLLYGNVYYLRQQSLKDSIRYGQLRFKEYFETKRYDFSLKKLQAMQASGAIYMIKRPEQNMLYGNYINDPEPELGTSLYIPGKRENIAGISLLNAKYSESNLSQAFERFSRSAQLGYAKGQVNLAQMYVNGQFVDKDFSQAMYWFKQAALQSDKSAILKYVIICRQVSGCQEGDFYQELTQAGVNIKVRKLDFNLN